MKHAFWSIGLVVLALGLGACRSAPVYNVDEATVVTSKGKGTTAADVRKAIIRAGQTLGWAMKDAGKGHIIGIIHLRTHRAEVDINYTPSTYSIHYKDSADLNYDGTNIHSNYNGWVQRLQQNIDVQLSML